MACLAIFYASFEAKILVCMAYATTAIVEGAKELSGDGKSNCNGDESESAAKHEEKRRLAAAMHTTTMVACFFASMFIARAIGKEALMSSAVFAPPKRCELTCLSFLPTFVAVAFALFHSREEGALVGELLYNGLGVNGAVGIGVAIVGVAATLELVSYLAPPAYIPESQINAVEL